MAWSEAENTKRFEMLLPEWAKISDLARWTNRIAEVRAENQALRRKGLWLGGPRDLLGVIGHSRRETTHSAVIAWLLDPTRRHGLGAEFLRRILGLLVDDQFEGLEQARSDTEVTRGTGRADIVVWGSNFTVIIENKVDDVEGDGQCDYYLRAFRDELRPLFVFLTPDGRPLDKDKASPEAAEEYHCLGYTQIAAALQATLDSTQVIAGAEARSVAACYLEALRHEFPETN